MSATITRRARRRLFIGWGVANALRVGVAFVAIAASAALSVHASVWIGIPSGPLIYGVGLVVLQRLERVIARVVLRGLPALNHSHTGTLWSVTQAMARSYWGIEGVAQPFLLARRCLDALIVTMYLVTQISVVRFLLRQ